MQRGTNHVRTRGRVLLTSSRLIIPFFSSAGPIRRRRNQQGLWPQHSRASLSTLPASSWRSSIFQARSGTSRCRRCSGSIIYLQVMVRQQIHRQKQRSLASLRATVGMHTSVQSTAVRFLLPRGVLEYGLRRPAEPATMALIVIFVGQEFDHCDECVCRNSGQYVPPSVQLKQDTPGVAHCVLHACHHRTEMYIDVPEEVCKECCRRAKAREVRHLPFDSII